MRIARYIIFALCVIMTTSGTVLVGLQYFGDRDDQFLEVLFCALSVLATVGVLGFFFQFIIEKIGFFLRISSLDSCSDLWQQT